VKVAETGEHLRITASPEIYLKSRRTRDRFMRILLANLDSALADAGFTDAVRRTGYHRLAVTAGDLDTAADRVASVFGVGSVARVEPIPFAGLEDLAETVAELARDEVGGRTFAVRIRRRGRHGWNSLDGERLIGSRLLDASAGVNLDDPEVTVRLFVEDDSALLVRDERPGANGLPVGTQDPALCLLSGGFDSPVAAWMMLRTGCPVDFIHFELECSVTDQALAVAHELAIRWCHGVEPSVHVIDFQPVKHALTTGVDPRLRQVVLKQMMLQAAERVAEKIGTPMLVTGEALGQVSSQTAANLVELDRSVGIPILRPLVAMRKEEIMERSKHIGTHGLSVRTREVCDLSEGRRVATSVSTGTLLRAAEDVGPGLVDEVLTTWNTADARSWTPGVPIGEA
jgi:thiamine biosynthesis protein ThiI